MLCFNILVSQENVSSVRFVLQQNTNDHPYSANGDGIDKYNFCH
jgi:hypothetical protein